MNTFSGLVLSRMNYEGQLDLLIIILTISLNFNSHQLTGCELHSPARQNLLGLIEVKPIKESVHVLRVRGITDSHGMIYLGEIRSRSLHPGSWMRLSHRNCRINFSVEFLGE